MRQGKDLKTEGVWRFWWKGSEAERREPSAMVMTGKAALRAVVRGVSRVGNNVRKRLWPGRVRAPLYRSALLEDFLFSQLGNVPVRLLRLLLRGRSAVGSGVTVVIVNYNTGDVLRDVLPAVRRFSDPDLKILVLDNASTDDSWVWLSSRPYGIRAIRLPMNVGHGRALDLGFLLARTSVVVTLDPDAFPFSAEWLDMLLDPLADPELRAAGAWGRRERLHPACAAYRRQEVLQTEISFHNYKPHLDTGEPPQFGVNCFDTGEFLSRELGANRIALLPVRVSENGWGEVIGGAVYHHRAVTGYDTDSLALRQQRRQLWEDEVRSLLG